MAEEARIALKQVRVIDAVARTRSFEQAARTLNTSQPVVSRTIASAEKALGIALFQRGWSGTEPTSWGEATLKHCSAALKLIQKAEDEIAIAGGPRPNLRAFLRWHHLDAVAAVVRLGSASAASVHLNMTQPAISRSIAAITQYSKQVLFNRRRDGLEATGQARRLAALREELLQELDGIATFKPETKRGLIDRLAVGMLPFSGQNIVAKVFGTLTDRYPDLRLMAVPGSYNMLAEALRRREIDCMVGILRGPSPFNDLREIFLHDEKFTLVARHDHPCHSRPVSISTLQDEKWIVAPHGTPVRAYFEELFRNVGAVPPTQTCEILSFGNAEQVIMNSNSIGLLSYSDENLKSLPDRLRKVEIDLPGSEIAIGLTVRKSGGLTAILKVFEDHLRGQAS
ncbi:LysR family transcriptional regulator [Chelativorans xinjiangense]|uniref:LysR family transcriptional regulator n=1 Tax=Chelativorans xinjiangense TaxID=2681485 RepID=UPI001356C27A|nr:LysR family transcriptional regulator [Chelativorans xinjiangense]